MNWITVGASVVGQSHIKNGLPCQDSFAIKGLGADYGIAVVSDGAGSASKAQLGSAYLTANAIAIFEKLLIQINFPNQKPSLELWQETAFKGLLLLKNGLEKLAKEQKTDLKELSATLLLIVYASQGILSVHIGDGRAAFLNQENVWKPLMRPWKGEYANETVFMSSDIWEGETWKNYVLCGITDEPPFAFALLTDGCERHSFICNVWDEALGKFYDPNLPFENFFNPLMHHILQMYQQGASQELMTEKWAKFLAEGNEKLKNEPDDKTMILGVRLV